jgi:hypothetical protein
VLTARRAAQHFRLSVPHDAYEYLCILTILPELRPISALCWQIHRLLTVLVPLSRVDTLSEGFERSVASPLLPRRLRAMGCAVWSVLYAKQSFPAALQVAACGGTPGWDCAKLVTIELFNDWLYSTLVDASRSNGCSNRADAKTIVF